MMKHKPRVWMSYNPVPCWINEYEGEGIELIHSTIDDNNFVNEEYRKRLDRLKKENYNYYLIYRLGLEGQIKGLIYQPYNKIDEFPNDNWFDEIIYGLDFGYVHQSAFLFIGRKENDFYLKELIYKTGLTNSDLIREIDKFILPEQRHRYIYADAAEPDRIEEICRGLPEDKEKGLPKVLGFNCFPCLKGQGSVKMQIDYCKRFKYYTTSESVNLEKERSMYVYKEDKDGNSKEEPVDFNDHLMKAKAYAIWTHYKDRLGMESLLDVIKDYDSGDYLESSKDIL